MISLTNRLRPLLSGAASLSDIDAHTRASLDIYIHFRSSALADLPPDQIKAELARMPEAVRGLVRAKTWELWKARRDGY